MNTFLHKIAQVPTIINVVLLSHQGEILFSESNQSSLVMNELSPQLLHTIVLELNRPSSATLYFSRGCLYLHSTTIGYIVTIMSDDTRLKMLKDACHNGGEKLKTEEIGKKILLSMLEKAADGLKPRFIKALVPCADKEVALSLMKILAQHETYRAEARDSIILTASQALGYCSHVEAVSSLKKILSESKAEKVSLDVFAKEAIELAIFQLELEKPAAGEVSVPTAQDKGTIVKTKEPIKKAAAAPPKPVIPENLKSLPERTRIESLVSADKKPEALALILSLIETATKNKEFDKAESLQEWLLQIEPMALAESIRATELIEESKIALIDGDFYRVWQAIVEILTTEEFIALYHVMERRNYANGDHLAEQGQIHSELFFVNTGRVQLYTHIDGREIPLHLVQEGGILGHGTFFELSVWTCGAKSQGAEVYALSYDKLQTLDKKYPGIESKLSDYCSHIETSSNHLQKMKRSRRQLERKEVSGKVTFILLGTDGQKTKMEGRGNLLDISQGGICFTVHSSQRKNTHQLFGRQIALMIKRSSNKPHIERSGKIIAVRDHDIIGNAYSVHVQFDTILTGTEMREIVAFSQ